MAGTVIYLPPQGGGSAFFGDPVTNFGDLPVSGAVGEVRLVTSTGLMYYWDGATWVSVDATVDVGAFADTNSVDLALNGSSQLIANLKLSSASAGVGFQAVPLIVETDGLRAQLTNNPTFTNLAATQYTGSVVGRTTAPSAGFVGEIVEASQATNTVTGVGATSAWGSVTSISLTAGRWAIQGVVGFNDNGATLTTSLSCGVSDSATGVGISEFDTSVVTAISGFAADALFATPTVLVNPSSTTTYHLNTRFFYTAGAPRHRGRIRAVRYV